jgi:hypothetical protein
VRTFRRPWPDSVNAGEIEAVEYALDKTDWQQDRRRDGPVN